MKKVLVVFLASISLSMAHAGQEVDGFKSDIKNYLSEQQKKPDKIIKYTDKNGMIAKSVLNPGRIEGLVAEVLAEANGAENLKSTLELFKPIASNYGFAFGKYKGEYNEEYLDSLELSYRLVLSGFKPLVAIKVGDVTDDSLRAILTAGISMARSIPPVFSDLLNKQIKNGDFGPEFRSQAEARREKFILLGQQLFKDVSVTP